MPYTTILAKNVRMTSTKQRTIVLCAMAIATVSVLFASGPVVATHQAYAWGAVSGSCGGCCGFSGLG